MQKIRFFDPSKQANANDNRLSHIYTIAYTNSLQTVPKKTYLHYQKFNKRT